MCDKKSKSQIVDKLTAGKDSSRKKLLSRFYFNSDFMINLLMTGSYYEYLKNFHSSKSFTKEKDLFSMNPEYFLFR